MNHLVLQFQGKNWKALEKLLLAKVFCDLVTLLELPSVAIFRHSAVSLEELQELLEQVILEKEVGGSSVDQAQSIKVFDLVVFGKLRSIEQEVVESQLVEYSPI